MSTVAPPAVTDEIAGLKLDPKYQWLPAMLPEDFGRLKASIAEHGFLPDQAVVVDEDGHILDGHHRARACAELGIECPTRRLTGLTDAEKEEYVWSVNLNRRHIPLAERLKLVRHRVQVRPEASNRAIARDVHVSHETVGRIRDEMEQTGEIASFAPSEGGRGKTEREWVDWQSWPRCALCQKPVKPQSVHEAEDGRQGHRKCLEPGVGEDLPEHRGLCRAYVSFEYPVANENDIHNRAGLPYPRESEYREWESGMLALSMAAPTNRFEADRLFCELRDRLNATVGERPFLTMVDG